MGERLKQNANKTQARRMSSNIHGEATYHQRPNGGGKSSSLWSICVAALLGICGLMVPAESAPIPYFDSIIAGTSKRSLVLVDEICRGTKMPSSYNAKTNNSIQVAPPQAIRPNDMIQMQPPAGNSKWQ
ncbi:hypothetical protein KIW84_042807 [Lathyrus oleraceus]|uniref:Uncharacterized protein n=1 Tax=Pisum sativum TaxID=3888 RepID=A0A9D4XDN3_PEA|nr:hypothetical protein KIW84_042807 [Pisum sativum]